MRVAIEIGHSLGGIKKSKVPSKATGRPWQI